MGFTPNIDIARDPRWGRVGETFGEDTFLVSEMGVAVIEGLQQGIFQAIKRYWLMLSTSWRAVNLSMS